MHSARDGEGGLSQAALLSLVEHAPDGVFVANLEGHYVYVNDASCRMLGYTRAELMESTFFDLIGAGDTAQPMEFKEVMQKGGSHAAEWLLRCKDGSRLPVEVSANILPQGLWQGFMRDISERKSHQAQREEHLRRTDSDRRWLRAVLDKLPLAVLLFEPGGTLSTNLHAEHLLGNAQDPSGASGAYGSVLYYPDGRPVPQEELISTRVLRKGETLLGQEYLIRRKNGTETPVLGSAAPIQDANGKVIGGVAAFQDLSERMHLERAARESERLLKAVFDILPVGIWIADKTGHLVDHNPAAERVWGGARHVGIPDFDQYRGWRVDTGKPIAPEEWGMARAITRGETSTGELVRIQCFDGSFKTIIHSAAPLRGDDGRTAGGIVVNEDITALYQAQEQLRAAVRDREEMLAVVAHDLRNPLGAVMMKAEVAEQMAQDILGADAIRRAVSSIIETSRGMADLVDDLLAIAVSGPGRSMLKIEPVEARELLAKAHAAAEPAFARAGITLEATAINELPTLPVDANRILRVFANLLDNAAKFTEPRGVTILRAEAVTGAVRFCVGNSGPALGSQELEKLFQPFWQAGRRDRRGAGLGLSICRAIIEAHGGSVWAEPASGMRVRICFLLPSAVHSGRP